MILFIQPPRHPGAILRDDFLPRVEGATQSEIADSLGMSRQRLNDFLNAGRSVTPDTALRLARVFGTDAEFWMDAQSRYDLYRLRADRSAARQIEALRPLLTEAPPMDSLPHRVLHEVGDAQREAERPSEALHQQFLRSPGLLDEADRFIRVSKRRELIDNIARSAGLAIAART